MLQCSGETPCSTCVEQSKTMIVEQPCVKADFFQIVESGTCNYICMLFSRYRFLLS